MLLALVAGTFPENRGVAVIGKNSDEREHPEPLEKIGDERKRNKRSSMKA